VDNRPTRLSEVLLSVASRLRKVDLQLAEELPTLWSRVEDVATREHCRPLFIKDGLLHIEVPSGAYAERVRAQTTTILEIFATLGDRAPHSLKITLQR
jgi:Dna[CI] antecedent, DciA